MHVVVVQDGGGGWLGHINLLEGQDALGFHFDGQPVVATGQEIDITILIFFEGRLFNIVVHFINLLSILVDELIVTELWWLGNFCLKLFLESSLHASFLLRQLFRCSFILSLVKLSHSHLLLLLDVVLR